MRRAGPARRLERQHGEVTEASDACPGTRPQAKSVGETLKGYERGSDMFRLTFWKPMVLILKTSVRLTRKPE